MATKTKKRIMSSNEKWMNTYHDMFIAAHNTLIGLKRDARDVSAPELKRKVDKYLRTLKTIK